MSRTDGKQNESDGDEEVNQLTELVTIETAFVNWFGSSGCFGTMTWNDLITIDVPELKIKR